jgi:t-SNARE complex subunit (syntaxin)
MQVQICLLLEVEHAVQILRSLPQKSGSRDPAHKEIVKRIKSLRHDYKKYALEYISKLKLFYAIEGPEALQFYVSNVINEM